MNSQYAACSSPTSRPAKSSPDPPHFPRVTRVTGIAEPQCGPNRVRPEHRPRDVGDGDVTRVALEVAVNAESLRSVTRVTPVTRRSWSLRPLLGASGCGANRRPTTRQGVRPWLADRGIELASTKLPFALQQSGGVVPTCGG